MADKVILCAASTCDLGPELDALGLKYRLIGDCRRIGDALYATRDGAEAAFAV